MKGNFFVYAPNPLSRMKIAHNNIYPDTFFAKDLFIWCPLTSFPEFNYVCIVEGCKGSLKKEGWPSDPAARRVYSLGNSYYIFARQYCCKQCNKKFLATNPEFMQSLPIYVQELFPAFMTHRSGIDKGLLNFIFSLLGEGNPISGLRNTLKEIFYLNYDRKRFQYYSYCRDLIIGSSLRNSGSLSLNLRETVIVHKFGQISSKNGFNEYIPSVKYLNSVFLKKHNSLRPWYDNRVSMIPVQHLKIDHSHKVTGRIRFDGVKIFSGLFTAVTETNQIRLQNFVFSKSLDEISPSLKNLGNTLQKRGHEKILSVCTDNCCKDRSIVTEAFNSVTESIESQKYPFFQLPQNVQIIQVTTDAELDQICPVIINSSESQSIILGIDAEWNWSENSGRGKVALLQISYENCIYLIRLSKIKSLNDQLLQILVSPRIIKTGRNVGGDIRAMLKDLSNDYL